MYLCDAIGQLLVVHPHTLWLVQGHQGSLEEELLTKREERRVCQMHHPNKNS